MLVAERSTCERHHIGAVIVKNKRILTTGYNGACSGGEDCLELGCLRNARNIPSGERHEICRAVHSEQNAIIQAGLHGVSIESSTIYCTQTPCMICAKMIVNSKIIRYVTYGTYADKEAITFIRGAGVKLEIANRPHNVINFLD